MGKLTVENVTKKYKDTVALNDVSFEIGNGITALLGNNGAGKSTLINIIVGLLKPDFGAVKFNNFDCYQDGREYRSMLGFLPQECGYYDNYRAYNFLEYMGRLKGLNKSSTELFIEKYMKSMGLWEYRKRTIRQYSGGMKHRLGIVQAMLNEPELLILDEPTTGLDYTERKSFKNMISEYADNHSVILSTHILSDIEDIANHILILDSGKLRYNSEVNEGDEIEKIMGEYVNKK